MRYSKDDYIKSIKDKSPNLTRSFYYEMQSLVALLVSPMERVLPASLSKFEDFSKDKKFLLRAYKDLYPAFVDACKGGGMELISRYTLSPDGPVDNDDIPRRGIN